MTRRKWIGYLLLNVLVSAAVTLGILAWYDRRQQAAPPAEVPLIFQGNQFEVAAVVGPGVLETEYVVLHYIGSEPIQMENWALTDGEGRVYRFPALQLYPDGAVEIYTAAGEDTPVALHWGLDAPVWASGKQVLLFNPQGVLHAVYRVP